MLSFKTLARLFIFILRNVTEMILPWGTSISCSRFETFIRNAFAKKEHAASIVFDLEKAYDTTWKYYILKDLFDTGLKGKLPNFISNFLSEREFNVRVKASIDHPFHGFAHTTS
jgi:hypothetical protein